MKKTPKQKFYHLTNSTETEFYSCLRIGGEITLLKTMKKRSYAVLYSFAQAKECKAWLLSNQKIFSMIIPN